MGTAGHIDHGKTSLVYALTGIDTDGLKEEKERGISIDLGFAQLKLPEGRVISFVDVPGHERFVRNMLAGAAGMEAVMLIVAATESVMPQTREHFQICQLLGLRHGLIVLTKIDLANEEQRAAAKRNVRELVAGSFMESAPILEVSAVTRVGMPELVRQLSAMAGQKTGRDKDSVMRMPVDRSFALKGFGTVLTGTLQGGMVKAGETLEILPQGAKVRVRGLQSQHATVEQASAGQRVAVNITGVEQQDVKRGNVLVSAHSLGTTRLLDVELQWLDAELAASAREVLVLHIGTAEISARVSKYANSNLARLRANEAVLALPGDRFVLRRPSPAQTVGGGVVVDAFPPRRLNRTKSLARLQVLSKLDLSRRIEMLLDESTGGRSTAELIRMTGASRMQLHAAMALNQSIVMSGDDRAVSRRWLAGKRKELVTWLREFHKANPNAAGAPLAGARLGLDAALALLVFKDFDEIRMSAEIVALASHRPQFSEAERAALQKIEHAYLAGGFQPPALAEVIAGAGVDQKKARALLELLVKSNRLIRLPDDLIFHADVITHIKTSLAKQKGLRFSVADFKNWMNISRKFAIPLLEHLDQQRVTRREGEMRVVL